VRWSDYFIYIVGFCGGCDDDDMVVCKQRS
jgi:hypothetical protein